MATLIIVSLCSVPLVLLVGDLAIGLRRTDDPRRNAS
jgi:hypothetical protein